MLAAIRLGLRPSLSFGPVPPEKSVGSFPKQQLVIESMIGRDLKIRERRRRSGENVALTVNSRSFNLHLDYSYSLITRSLGE